MAEETTRPSGTILQPARFPGRAPIDAYGNGGFRFADMSHRGSILVLPSSISAWDVSQPDKISVASLEPLLLEADQIEVLLIGCGSDFASLPSPVRDEFRRREIGFDLMSTGAAVRTFNVLLSENRAVAAALIAVERP